MNTIRPYKLSDYNMIRSWWDHYKEFAPYPSMLPPESTFILEVKGVPALCVTIVLTNVKEYCYVENFAGNPLVSKEERRAAGHELTTHISQFAKSKGHRIMICLAYKQAIKKRYKELGFIETLDQVSTFCKVVGD